MNTEHQPKQHPTRDDDQNCAEGDWDEHGEGTRQAWRKDARAVLAALRETHDVTARAEQ